MQSQYQRNSTHNEQTQNLRQPLKQRSSIETNSSGLAAIRLVPKTPPRLLGPANENDEYYYSRTPLPTHSSHFLPPRKREDSTPNFQFKIHNSSSSSSSSNSSSSSRIVNPHSSSINPKLIRNGQISVKTENENQKITSTSSPRIKPSARKFQLDVHSDSKTFSLRFPEEKRRVPEEKIYVSEKSTFPKPCLKSSLSSSHLSNKSSIFANNGETQSTQGPSAHVTFETSCSQDEITNDSKTTIISEKPSKTILKALNKSTPCDNEFIGGLRKVSETPDHKEEAIVDEHTSSTQPFDNSSSTLPSQQQQQHLHHLTRRLSFSSATSSSSEINNYKVYSDVSSSPSSPYSVTSPNSNDSYNIINYHNTPKLGQQSCINQESNINDASESSSQVNLLLQNTESPKALSPVKSTLSRLTEKSIRSSLTSRKLLTTTSTASLLPQEALRTVFSSNELVPSPLNSASYNQNFIGASSWDGNSNFLPSWSHMYEYPHQWSSQLSTVLSVSDENSDRESLIWSENSRLSITSRVRETGTAPWSNDQEVSRLISPNQSWDESIEFPLASFSPRPRLNSSSSIQMIAQPDEHGDIITDLHNMRIRPLRRRTSTFCSFTSSDNERTNTMKSTISSSSNITNLSLIPTWARLYYGSGHRRPLDFSQDMNGFDSDNVTISIRDPSQGIESQQFEPQSHRKAYRNNTQSDNLSLRTVPQSITSFHHEVQPMDRCIPQPNWISSWSPHLRPNKRIKRTCMRGPPSTVFSIEGGLFDRRNIQVVMFITGFLLPFFWMIASILPLPPLPLVYLSDHDRNSPSSEVFKIDRFCEVEEARYESARWWRKVNRWMSVIGVMLITTAVVLVILGLEQGWGMELTDY